MGIYRDKLNKVEYAEIEEDVDSYYVLQPNSPKNSNWVCRVSKKDVNIIYNN